MTPALHSKPLTRQELDQFLKAVRATSYCKEPKTRSGMITLRRPEIPDLRNYRIVPETEISFSYDTENVQDFVDRSFSILHACTPLALRAVFLLNIAESGRPFDTSEAFDVTLGYGFDCRSGPFLSFFCGTASPGYSDLGYRQRLFNRVFQILELDDELEAVFREGKLYLIAKTNRVFLPSGDPSLAPSNYSSSAHNLVLVGYAGLRGENFCQVSLHLFPPNELRAKLDTLVSVLGAEKVYSAHCGLSCQPVRFPEIRDILNTSGLSDWELTFWAESGLSMKDLDHIVASNEQITLNAFELRIPKVATSDVDIWYRENQFELSFHFYGRQVMTDKKMAQFTKIITKIASFEDFLRPVEQ